MSGAQQSRMIRRRPAFCLSAAAILIIFAVSFRQSLVLVTTDTEQRHHHTHEHATYAVVALQEEEEEEALRFMMPTPQLHTASTHDQQQRLPKHAQLNTELFSEWPKLVWLLSYPNSGTSYTMTAVERASNQSTASHYGAEVTPRHRESLPVHASTDRSNTMDAGPYWEGLGGDMKRHKVRHLPHSYVLTKTHCSGRCIHCGPERFVVPDATIFLEQGCARTSARMSSQKQSHGGSHSIKQTTMTTTTRQALMDYSRGRVAKVVHLIRHPLHNVISRFHLDRKNWVEKEPNMARRLTKDKHGFRYWCRSLDRALEQDVRHANVTTRTLVEDVHLMDIGSDDGSLPSFPCKAEFFKYTQWHNHALAMMPMLFGDGGTNNEVVLTLHYEDYGVDLDGTMQRILDFLEQPRVAKKLVAFRPAPDDYDDYYSETEKRAIERAMRQWASPATWNIVQRYFSETKHSRKENHHHRRHAQEESRQD